MRNGTKYLSVFLLLFLIIGGCDVDFGGTNDDDDGGGGNGGNTDEILRGTIIEVIPNRENNLSGITVSVMEDNAVQSFSDTTASSGTFFVEGNFASNNTTLEFLDDDNADELLGETSINVFPEAEVNLGNITLENGTVDIDEDDITVSFDADLIDINCTENSGSLTVESEGSDPIDIIIQVSNSTVITRDNDDIDCGDLLIGQTLDINGNLLGFGNNVDADTIEVE